MGYSLDDLKGKVAVVTGSGRGIGKEIAEAFASVGTNVVISDIDADTAKATAEEIAKTGVETLSVVCDVSNKEQVDAMFKQAFEKWGKIDILVNNAGITMDNLFMRMKPEQFTKVLEINLTGNFYCSQAANKYMSKARQGSIINMSSVNRYGAMGQANYSASKAGVVGLSNALSQEVAKRGIRVNSVAPGFIQTPMTDVLPEEMKDAVKKATPLGRLGIVEDIAKVILFLASDLSGFVNGQVIDVNGGLRTGL